MLEVLIAVLAGIMILLVAYNSLVSSSRVLTRGQNKMVATGQAELLFRYLENDFHSMLPGSAIAPVAPSFELRRAVTLKVGSTQVATVTWTFRPGVDGRGSYIERSIAGVTPAEKPLRLCVDALAQVRIDRMESPAHPGVSIKVLLKGVHDVTPAIFQETFFYQNSIPDPNWNVRTP